MASARLMARLEGSANEQMKDEGIMIPTKRRTEAIADADDGRAAIGKAPSRTDPLSSSSLLRHID